MYSHARSNDFDFIRRIVAFFLVLLLGRCHLVAESFSACLSVLEQMLRMRNVCVHGKRMCHATHSSCKKQNRRQKAEKKTLDDVKRFSRNRLQVKTVKFHLENRLFPLSSLLCRQPQLKLLKKSAFFLAYSISSFAKSSNPMIDFCWLGSYRRKCSEGESQRHHIDIIRSVW